MKKPELTLTYSNMIMCNGEAVNIEDLTPKEQEQVGNWLRRTPLEALGLGEVREVGRVQETQTA